MTKNKKYLVAFIIVMLLVFQSIIITAENPKEVLAISLVIDTSGSMNTTDPQRLRETAANIFIDLLGPEDYLGIITFNSKVDLVIPLEQLGDTDNRESYKAILNPSLNARGNTDYKAAFEKASEELIKMNDQNIRKVVVFLTDGEPDPDDIGKNPQLMSNYMNEFWETTISKLTENKLPVYSIGFSEEIDVEILSRIAAETKGDVRIFKDAADLDENLIQLLKSREIIATQLLAPTYEDNAKIMPSISTDFWMKQEGYRHGEEAVVSASLNIGSNRLQRRADLKIDQFNLIMNYTDGANIVLPLFDDGEAAHGDIKANDGLWSNKILFDKNGKAKATLIVNGSFKNEQFTLEKSIGEYLVDKPGNVIIFLHEENIWLKSGDKLTIPLSVESRSAFKEVIFIEVNESIGATHLKQIELEPNTNTNINLGIDLKSGLNQGFHNLKIKFKPLNELTTINNTELDYKIEIVSFVEGLSRDLKDKSSVIILLLIIFVVLPLVIYLKGIFLYLILVKPQTKAKGLLTYWKEASPGDIVEFNLNEKKKKKIVISFDPSKSADFYIEGSRFNYDIEITSEFIKKRKTFISGWKTLFTRDTNIIQMIRCTQPGIIIQQGDIYTSFPLYDDEEFSSGGFSFHFTKTKLKWSKAQIEGKNILEGRV